MSHEDAANEGSWPVATLDPIRRARVLAARIPGGFVETVLDVPYEHAWSWLSDLERSVPAFDVVVDRLGVKPRPSRRERHRRAPDVTATSARCADPVHRASRRRLVPDARPGPGLRRRDGRRRRRPGPHALRTTRSRPAPRRPFPARASHRDVRHDVKGIHRILTPGPEI